MQEGQRAALLLCSKILGRAPSFELHDLSPRSLHTSHQITSAVKLHLHLAVEWQEMGRVHLKWSLQQQVSFGGVLLKWHFSAVA